MFDRDGSVNTRTRRFPTGSFYYVLPVTSPAGKPLRNERRDGVPWAAVFWPFRPGRSWGFAFSRWRTRPIAKELVGRGGGGAF